MEIDHRVGAYEDQLAVRPVSAEEAFARQNDRIAFLRSHGLPWAEAVYELRDQLEGLEDPEFWDGIPDSVRPSMANMDVKERKKIQEHYAERGWITHSVTFLRYPDGSEEARPTAEELSRELRIIRALATRKGITWRTKRKSWLGFGNYEVEEEP